MKFDRLPSKGIGEQTFVLEDCKFKGPFFYEGLSEYLPLAAIIGDNIHSNLEMNISGYYYGLNSSEKKRQKLAYAFHTKVARSDSGIYRTTKGKISVGGTNLSDLMDAYMHAIALFLNKECGFELEVTPRGYQRATYDNLLRAIFGNQRKTYYFQSVKAITAGPGFVYSHAANDFLFCLVVPEELIKYQRLYFILNGEFDPNGMQFWVQKGFDTPKTLYKSFRQSYRKSIKFKMEEWGIEFVEKIRIADEMMPAFNVPAALNEIDEWKAGIARETLLAEREKLDFDFS